MGNQNGCRARTDNTVVKFIKKKKKDEKKYNNLLNHTRKTSLIEKHEPYQSGEDILKLIRHFNFSLRTYCQLAFGPLYAHQQVEIDSYIFECFFFFSITILLIILNQNINSENIMIIIMFKRDIFGNMPLNSTEAWLNKFILYFNFEI